ncbi:MAG: isoprenylcysteine carboxylmethyltransferase family protein [Smithella sp.]
MARLFDRIIDFIYRKAIRREKHHGRLTFLWGLFFFSAVLFIVCFSFFTDKMLNINAWPPKPANLVCAAPLLIAGIWLWLWSVLIFFKSRGTPVPVSPPPKLIDTGPYAYSRNPMLSGVFLMLFGIGFLFQVVSLIVLYTPLFILIASLEFKMIEEPELEKRFGSAYVEYRKRVPMFFPHFGRRKH